MSIPPKIRRLAGFSLTSADADRLAAFYMEAFGCRSIETEYLRGPAFEALMGVQGGARCIKLALGDEIIELLEFENPGASYPAESSASDLVFQHFAIVTPDMSQAWSRLSNVTGWLAITQSHPLVLPASAGDVTAFKFRDPEGHPLELLTFPAGRMPPKWEHPQNAQACLGIDHSAISVADAVASVAFYEMLGLKVTGRSRNSGPEQDRLDAIQSVHVEVVALSPDAPTPHVELLDYQTNLRSKFIPCRSNDIACTRLIFEDCGTAQSESLLDPDGHHLIFRSDEHL